jgi:hypothetical protein
VCSLAQKRKAEVGDLRKSNKDHGKTYC